MMVRKVRKDNPEMLELPAPQVNVDHQDHPEIMENQVPQGL